MQLTSRRDPSWDGVSRPGFIVMSGLPASGKSRLGAIIAPLLGLLGTLAFLGKAVPSAFSAEIFDMLANGQIGPALDTLLRHIRKAPSMYALMLFPVSIIILAWPPRRQQYNIPVPPAEGV